jgi:REP element-mobilizing transposase RayT
MSHTFTNIVIHALFGTKMRIPWINRDVKTDLFAYIGGIVRRLGGKPLIVGGFNDHIHILFVLPAQLPVSDVLEKVKANSSRWLHQRSATLCSFAWQVGYTAFSVSHSNVEAVRKYIAAQEEHHRKRTYREEVNALLRKHGIEPDARFDE